ncbi:MAG: hypothetical protein DRJ42_22580 [Deltaproteobacteria bacterium]|nr:MAG: hypothetical protein DRJ42_22580 [Deltaproteobacteria bacterium]
MILAPGTGRLNLRALLAPLVILALPVIGGGCAVGVGDGVEPSVVDLHPLDLEDVDDGKADGTRFNQNRIISDQAYGDTGAIDRAGVQAFLENTPYGTRSFLADLEVDGELVSSAFVRVAETSGLNPLLLLTTLQKETGLVSKTERPSTFRVDYAFGCGCPDGRRCDPAMRGLDRQLACAADALANPFTAPLRGEPTRAGKYLGDSIRTLDNIVVTPENRATLALYTYTPHVGRATRGGNWLFFSVWKRYVTHVGYEDGLRDRAAENFIGSACEVDADCGFIGGLCLDWNGGLFCSQPCTGICPDRTGHPTTFCTEVWGDGDGYCVARCEVAATDCLAGQYCEPTARFEDPGTTQNTCTF